MTYYFTVAGWMVALTSLAIVAGCIALHYEMLRACERWLPRISVRQRPRVLFGVSLMFVTHLLEILLFAVGYYVLSVGQGFGQLQGLQDGDPFAYIYFSAMTYTTVGFGDVVPVGPIRFLAGLEALTGLVMITWSASYTFLEMQRDWAR